MTRRPRVSRAVWCVVWRVLGLAVLCTWVAVIAPPATPAAEPPAAVVPDVALATAPVEVDGIVLFRVRGISSFPAAQRAAEIAARIETLAADREVQPGSLRVAEGEGFVRIMAGERVVTTLVEADAHVEGVQLRVLAMAIRNRIQVAIEEYRQARSPDALLHGVFYALAATVAALIAVVLLFWVARRTDAVVERRYHRRIKGLQIQSLELLRAEQVWGAVRQTLRVLRFAAVLVILFVCLQVVLSEFPWTRGLANQLLDLVLGPLGTMVRGVLAHVPNLIFLAVLFLVVRFAVRMTRLLFDAIGRGSVRLGKFDPEWAAPTYKIVRLALVAFGLVVAYPYIPGSESAAFKGISLFLGVVFSFGSSSAISNIMAGYMMTYRRAFKLGDRIKIGDVIGDVIEMRLQVTHLRSLKNEEVVVPNSLILNSQVVNYSSLAKERGLILHTNVGIGYETPWRQVEAMLLVAAQRTPGVLAEPAPFVLQRTLGDFAVDYELNAYTHDVQQMLGVYTALHRNILDVFNEYGVQIMTPAYVADPAQAKVVAREQWYTAPATDAPEAPTRRP